MSELPKVSRRFARLAIRAILCVIILTPSGQTFAKGEADHRETRSGQSLGGLKRSVGPVVHGHDTPAGESFTMNFRRTALDTDGEGTAFVVLGQGTMTVRVQVRDLPMPTRWHQLQYSLWVDLQNYGYKLHLGDLPMEAYSDDGAVEQPRYVENLDRPSTSTAKVKRGSSDSFFRLARVPVDAVFGGLIVTAEPPRYEAIINEPLNPVLVARVEEGDIEFGSLNKRIMGTTAPVYPMLARKYGISGTVNVFVVIDENGAVATVGRSNGPPLLVQSALIAVRKWTFRPVLVSGRRVPVKGFIAIHFTLK